MHFPDGFRPQLIALDLDDTLVSHDGSVIEAAVDAIARCQDAGIMVVAATGRSISTTHPVCHAAGMLDWAVCSNGAMLTRVTPEEIVETVTFDPAELLEQIAPLLPNAIYAVEDVHGVFHTNQDLRTSALGMSVRVVPFEHLLADPVVRLVVRSEEHRNIGLGHIAADLGLHSVVFGTGDMAWLDIGPKGVNKATMLQRLCDRLGFTAANTLVMGDSMNDIEMLKWAGVGVVMGHAIEAIKQHGNVITTDVPGQGVADALNALVL